MILLRILIHDSRAMPAVWRYGMNCPESLSHFPKQAGLGCVEFGDDFEAFVRNIDMIYIYTLSSHMIKKMYLDKPDIKAN